MVLLLPGSDNMAQRMMVAYLTNHGLFRMVDGHVHFGEPQMHQNVGILRNISGDVAMWSECVRGPTIKV